MTPELELRPTEYVCCNLCGADSTRPWGRRDGMEIVECRECGLIYTNPRLSEHQLRECYRADYFESRRQTDSEARGAMYAFEIRRMLSYIGSTGRFLDVGCADGRFLSRLPPTFDRYGVEFSAEAAAHGRQTFGLPIEVGQLPDIAFDDRFFDVVQFRGVFEHLQDPRRNLQAARRILKDGGWLVFGMTPNVAGPAGRLFRERFNQVDPRRHLYYFSTRTLARYCRDSGFGVEKVFYPYLGTPYANVLRDLWAFANNLIGGGQSPPFFRNMMSVYARKRPSKPAVS